MRNLLKLILVCLLILVAVPSFAQEGGRVILDIQEEPQDIDLKQAYQSYWDDVDFFDKKYPGTNIEEDFISDVVERHPDFADDSSALRENLLRKTIQVRRQYYYFKKQIQEYLLKNDIPITVADSEYEMGQDEPYQETDKPLIIKSFKKVIAYSGNQQDSNAVSEKTARDAGLPTPSENTEKMKQAFLKKDWKTLFTYGLFDGKSPFDDNRGLGDWQGEANELQSRLILSSKVINHQSTLTGAVQFKVPKNSLLLKEAYLTHQPLQLTFEPSANMTDITLNWPLPQRVYLGNQESAVGYADLVTVPFTLNIKDAAQPLKLSAQLKADVCLNKDCHSYNQSPQIELAAGTEEDFESKVASFLRLIEPYYPKSKRDDIVLTAAEIEGSVNPTDAQVLRIIIEADETPARIDAFLENGMQDKFSAPLIRVDGKRVVIRFVAKDNKADYLGKEFDILVSTSPQVSLRQTVTALAASPLSSENHQLNMAILWFALLGGFLLNFMPCVFPVLSIKTLSFTRFGAMKLEIIRQDLVFNMLGILASFVLLILALSILKLSGYAIGWGMQFQSIGFISFMVFVIALFMAQLMGLINLKLPEFIQKLNRHQERGRKMTQFLTGMFLVLLSTPCTAPYLGTAIGFALAGSILEMTLVLGCVGLGLALPYLLVACVPSLAYYVPTPGKWMRLFEHAMFAMLLLTLGWLLSLIMAQTSSALLWHYIFFIIAVWGVLLFRKVLIEELEHQENDPKAFIKISRIFNLAALVLILGIVSGAIYDAKSSLLSKAKYNTQFLETVDKEMINLIVRSGRIVLVKVGADWCLTCHYNDTFVFETEKTQELLRQYAIISLNVDWSRYNPEVLDFMGKFGRKGLPFYVLYAPRIPEGMVLPEVLNEADFEKIIQNLN